MKENDIVASFRQTAAERFPEQAQGAERGAR